MLKRKDKQQLLEEEDVVGPLPNQDVSVDVSQFRTINLDRGRQHPGHINNHVITAKYNALTFLPKFLFEVFSRLAYLYFLVQMILSWFPAISPFGGLGSTVALLFVVIVSGITALIEDFKRYNEDRATNRSIAHALQPDGSIKDIQWSDVQVGNLLMVKDDELLPADILCLYSDIPERVCYIKTTNLDGETNLKIRNALDLKEWEINSVEDVLALKGFLSVEPPSANLHNFQGRIHYTARGGSEQENLLTMDDVLLRGCMLKNSHFVIGVVMYTGPESRIQKNASATPIKVGSYDRFLNVMIILVIILQLILCFWQSIASVIFRNDNGMLRYYLALDNSAQGNPSNNFAYWIISFLTFWMLFSYLVPISLFVTMEIVKFIQGFTFINFDPEMKCPVSKEHARCRNRGLNEDLGKVEYVFSDKTGTLTGNEMQLRMITVKDAVFGRDDWRIEEHPGLDERECVRAYDPLMADCLKALQGDEALWNACLQGGGTPPRQLAAGALGAVRGDDTQAAKAMGQHILDFWLNLCVCQSLIVDPEATGDTLYQGPSPDEVALVDAARRLGMVFKGRSQGFITLEVQGQELKYTILNLQEFTSARGCMSVVAKAPDGTIRLYCKGADAKVLPRLSPSVNPALMERTNRNLHLFATKGLRTLLLGTRVMEEKEYKDWDLRYQAACADLDNRDTRIDALATEIEQNLELVGVTAIEDKLQDGVPEAIATLLDANIKVWMITGDKQETAINIGISCKLVRNPDSLMICNGDSYDEARARMTDIQARFATLEADARAAQGHKVYGELVIDGKTLSHVLGTDLEPVLAQIGAKCHSVVICRASPSQKASIVRMMADYEQAMASGDSKGLVRWWKRYSKRIKGKMLSIGDGANDVAMIQAADIGVGIMGKEGRQAVNNSDYAIAQFRFLVRLLLVHGTLSHYRLARLIKYSFYKNIAFNMILFWFQFFCGYSGTTIIDGIPATFYNIVFTSLPVLFFSLLDRPVKYFTTLMRYPQLYRKQQSLTVGNFLNSGVWVAIVDATIIFFIPYWAASTNGQHTVTDFWSLGNTAFFGLLGVVTMEIMLVARYWTWLFFWLCFLSYAVGWLFYAVYPFIVNGTGQWDGAWSAGATFEVFSTGYFWFSILTTYALCFGYRYFQRVWLWLYRPQDSMILTEKEMLEGAMGGTMTSVVRRRLKTLLRRKEERDLAGLPSQATTIGPGGASVGMVPSPQPSVMSHNDNDEAVLNKGARQNGYSDGVL